MQPRSMRARRQDRDVALDLLAEAYADEALTREEYDERVDRAQAAVTTDELDALVADLRIDDQPVVLQPFAALESLAKRLIISAVAVVGVVGIGWAVAFALTGDDDEPTPAPPAVPAYEFPDIVMPDLQLPDLEEAEPEAAPVDAFSRADIDRFIRRYEARYGDTLAYEVVLRPEHIDFVRPTGASGENLGRAGSWGADGFSRLEGPRDMDPSNDEPTRTVDLSEVNVRALVRNLDWATDNLGIEDAEVSLAFIEYDPDFDRSAHVKIHAGDDLGHGTYMTTTLSGRHLRVFD